jgi:phosphoribosylformylglycinamidine synthase subunit PurQ / glutaminase
MRWGVVTFPGSLDNADTVHALTQVLGDPAVALWHKDRSLQGVDCVVLPGGFSYGDYLRAGALARFSPVMESVVRFASDGGLVFGICNGFQVLCEAGLLPGALIRNRSLSFVCAVVHCRVEEADTPFTRSYGQADVLALPVKHGEGCYVADADTLQALEDNRQIVLRYVDAAGRATEAANPNGSLRNIAGIVNASRNVFGLMPHPEHACEPLCGGVDGAGFFRSVRATLSDGAPLRTASVPPGL